MAFMTGSSFIAGNVSCIWGSTWVTTCQHKQLRAGRNEKRVAFPQRRVTTRMQMYEDDGTYPMNGSSFPSGKGEGENQSVDDSETFEASTQVVDAEVRGVPLNELKCELYATLASVNRGFAVTLELRTQIDQLLMQIEQDEITKTIDLSKGGGKTTFISGNWRLMYTNANDVLSLGLLTPLSINISQIYQPIEYDESADNYKIENVIEIEPLFSTILSGNNRTYSKLKVSAKGQVVQSNPKSLNLSFESVQFQPQSVFGMGIPAQIKSIVTPPKVRIASPVGELETTFVDEDIRIGRARLGNTNNVFVFIREP